MGVAGTPPKANQELGRESVATDAQGSVSPLQEDEEIQKFPYSWYLPSSSPGPTPPSLAQQCQRGHRFSAPRPQQGGPQNHLYLPNPLGLPMAPTVPGTVGNNLLHQRSPSVVPVTLHSTIIIPFYRWSD